MRLADEKIGYERLIELTCNPALPNFTLTKLLWVRTHEPEIFAKIRHILCPKDYVRYRLTGEYAIDVQEASGTLLLDVTHRRWSSEVADAAGIPESWLPKVYESPEVCARISECGRGADRAGCWNAGGGGRRRPGRGRGGHGDSATGFGFRHDRHFRRGFCRNGRAYQGPQGPAAYLLPRRSGAVACDGRNPVGGPELALAQGDLLSPARTTTALTEAAAKIPAGSEGLEWAPYLLGERTPHLDPEVRAAFAGISTVHTAAHFVRAVLEGVAYSLEDTFTLFAELGIPVSAIRLGGGGARGPLWRKIQAGIYGQAVEVLTAEEGGAFGSRADGRSGRGPLGQPGRSLRPGDRSCAAHRAGRRGPGGLQGRLCEVAQALSGAEELAVGRDRSAAFGRAIRSPGGAAMIR